MNILGIETSCDETAISIIETFGTFPNDFDIKIRANLVLSQIALHQKYGGVFPSLAKREHSKNLVPLFKQALETAELLVTKEKVHLETPQLEDLKSLLIREPEMWEQFEKEILKIEKPKIDAIAVTMGPGLEPALWTGINFARALSAFWKIPILPINHMEGHIFSSLLKEKKGLRSFTQKSNDGTSNEITATKQEKFSAYKLESIKFPAIALLVSGGHTELVLAQNWFEYKVIGATRDDAVGEAFDKVARILGLPYPGGPEISRLAKILRDSLSDLKNSESRNNPIGIKLPRPMINSNDYDFSFSGIKTAVLYMVKKIPELTNEIKNEIALEFENAVVETLVKKTTKAVLDKNALSLIAGGGVIANRKLRDELEKMTKETKIELFVPIISHSTDNALMIALACGARIEKYGLTKERGDIIASGSLTIDGKK